MSTSTAELCREIAHTVDELGPILDEHVEDNDGELLPHVFFGDVTRWAERTASADPGAESVRRLIAELDRAWKSGDDDVQELIAVSFLENLDADSPLVTLLTPTLADELESAELETDDH